MYDKFFFGTRIRELRNIKKVNQTEIANLIGVTKTQISDIENGKISTTIEKLVILADYFDVSVDYLLGLSDDPTRH